MRFAALASTLGVSLLMAGSLGACTKYPSCRKDDDCRGELGEVCVGGSCQNCRTDADCVDKTPPSNSPWSCIDLRCQPGPSQGLLGGGGEEGDPCTQRADCYGGLACLQGVCSTCTGDVDCAPATCNPATGRCSPDGACETDDQCAMDEICDGGMCVFSGLLGNEDGGPCGLAAVYFAFDSDVLTPKAQDELATAAECIAAQGLSVILEAHADDRGTEEYNIMLTERRGRQVEEFLVERGVADDLLSVLAKGSLEAEGRDEPSRAKDRRVALLWPQ